MNKKEKKLWIVRLKPFWKLREDCYDNFRKQERKIEETIKEVTGEDLEFFYGDMYEGCTGIGHADWERRNSKKANYFPLIHGSDL